MSDTNAACSEPTQLHARTAGGRGVFQFSLTGMFVFITVLALILSAHFTVGRWMGMSDEEVARVGLLRLLFTSPTLLVWLVGLSIAIGRLKRNRLPAILTIVALSGLLLGMVALNVAQMALIHSIISEQVNRNWLAWFPSAQLLFHQVLFVISWILMLVAIFIRRPPDAAVETPIRQTEDDGAMSE
jgi:uncharacterized membrane protein